LTNTPDRHEPSDIQPTSVQVRDTPQQPDVPTFPASAIGQRFPPRRRQPRSQVDGTRPGVDPGRAARSTSRTS